ncbi:sulfur carrier protein ThiS [Bacteroides sp. 224]|uniref:sulfur carrier protein ThiS n=1 Tax=Bacteroides sp. 224 TaxID=2302936 RepID=UPI0019402E58|nr:sulfur carrier protein ThiS [Bacteroides sp. 224]
MITIQLNNKPYKIEVGTTLISFIESLEIKPQGIAIAINYEVIPKELWETTILSNDMELMLIHAVSGG